MNQKNQKQLQEMFYAYWDTVYWAAAILADRTTTEMFNLVRVNPFITQEFKESLKEIFQTSRNLRIEFKERLSA